MILNEQTLSCLLYTSLQEFVSDLRVEQTQEIHGVIVVDGTDNVRILDVVDKRDVLVADTFNAVTAEAVVQDGGEMCIRDRYDNVSPSTGNARCAQSPPADIHARWTA